MNKVNGWIPNQLLVDLWWSLVGHVSTGSDLHDEILRVERIVIRYSEYSLINRVYLYPLSKFGYGTVVGSEVATSIVELQRATKQMVEVGTLVRPFMHKLNGR